MGDHIELSPTGWVREQTERILEQGTTDGVEVYDRPIILVTTTGAKSGKQRYVPLMRVEDGGRYLMVASKGGAPDHPAWYFNVKANPHVTVHTHAARLAAANALALIGRYDVVADGSDNFATRYLVADACFFAKKPLVTAAVGIFDGTLTTLRAHERKADGTPHPTYRCLFPEPPPPGTVPACAEAGILGALTGVLGSLMALEVIREIVGFGEGLVGRLLMFDARAMRFETLQYAWDPSNPLSGEHPTIKDLSLHP